MHCSNTTECLLVFLQLNCGAYRSSALLRFFARYVLIAHKSGDNQWVVVQFECPAHAHPGNVSPAKRLNNKHAARVLLQLFFGIARDPYRGPQRHNVSLS